jgi:Ca-activated chloride channel family protein
VSFADIPRCCLAGAGAALLAFAAWAVARAAAARGAPASGRRPRSSRRLLARRAPRVRDALLAAAWRPASLALRGPSWETGCAPCTRARVDLMVVLDTSRSMLARDIAPTRLERAKREIRGLLDRLRGDRVGLVSFAGDARLICPLTADPASFRLFLDDVDTTTNAPRRHARGRGPGDGARQLQTGLAEARA